MDAVMGGRVMALAWASAAVACLAGEPRRAESAAARRTLADLEVAYWACDHASERDLLDPGTAAACGAAAGELQRRKFNGDFDAMLAWWQRNKSREHRRLDLREGAPAR
jgi:hypothetical protein